MTTEQIVTSAGAITAVAGALLVLWRYVVNPLWTVTTSLRKHSNEISNALPLLREILEKWSSPSGPGSFFHFINSLETQVFTNEARATAILELTPLPIYECSITGDCIFANDALCHLCGLSHEEMLGRGWLAGVHPDDRERVFSTWKSAIQKCLPYECTYTVRHSKTGNCVNVTTRALPLQSNGKLFGYYGVYQELTPSNPRKIDIHLECGCSFEADDVPKVREYLATHSRIMCPECRNVNHFRQRRKSS